MPRPQSNLRRWRAAAGLAIAATAGFASVGGGADAAPRTSSLAVAAEAQRAVSALDRWERTQSPADYVRFVRGRDRTAALAARELELDARELGAAWAGAPAEKQHVLLAALSQLGVPYRYRASEPGVAFDCSGLTGWAYADAGVGLPRVSRDQIRAADEVARDHAEPGDLVYYPGHIGIYLGVDYYVHSPNSGNDVVASHLPSRRLRFGDAVPEPVERPMDWAGSVA
jgi:cell wall-associated NlpC family hydrolase